MPSALPVLHAALHLAVMLAWASGALLMALALIVSFRALRLLDGR